MDGLGTELPQRHTFVWFLLIAALVFAVPVFRTARTAAGESGGTAIGGWAMAVVMALVLVVVPLLLVRSILARHTYVSDEAVSVVTGGDVRQQIAFDDLTEIKVRYSGRGGSTLRNEKVFLSGPLRAGSGTVLVSRFYVDSLQPLLQRLEAEVAERPELLKGEVERDYFEHALTTAP
ncbi:unannotated protein [freshwater metagenome]|jgi:hypothetical protein|uniref:Unannotated protein n=1 Tax=freshwater metagenome TaxID=449393 RepID=A0A6J7HJ98_9ZZZZ|nr:hypothetical protein [Actinomycetota bacterium]